MGEMKLRKINPQRLFSMADSERANRVEFRACLDALRKMIPDLSAEFLDEIPPALGKSMDDIITKSEFD